MSLTLKRIAPEFGRDSVKLWGGGGVTPPIRIGFPQFLQINTGDSKPDVCVTVHHQYNDVGNQQDATTFSFIRLFKSALHVSGDKFAHSQEHFLTIYSFWYNEPTLLPTGSSVGALYQKLYIQSKKFSWGWATLSPETCRADLKTLIKDKVVASFWFLTSFFH